jgi:hypothetical protein
MPASAHLRSRAGSNASQMLKINGDPLHHNWDLQAFWPEPAKLKVPELLPPDVERSYLQAERNFAQVGNEEASGMMYRKALDVAVKKIELPPVPWTVS